jgi:endonuclease/exonuclease/phosphatase family metal-dependent hydrolase
MVSSLPQTAASKSRALVFKQPINPVSNLLDSLVLSLYIPIHFSSELFMRSLTPLNQERLGLFGNSSSFFYEIMRRITDCALAVLSLPVTLCLVLPAVMIDLMNRRSGKFIVMQGFAKTDIKPDHQLKIFNLNACMLWGALPMLFGGVVPARHRIEALDCHIKENDPDLVLLQEMSRAASYSLWSKIQDRYSLCLTSVTPQPLLMLDAGLFIASKQNILDICYLELTTNGLMKRSLVGIELEKAWVFVTHLAAGHNVEDIKTRKQQVLDIEAAIEKIKMKTHKPVILAGDLNILRTFSPQDEYSQSGLPERFHNLDKADQLNEKTSTCTNYLSEYVQGIIGDDQELELIDFILVHKADQEKVTAKTYEKIETYDKTQPLKAFSDHKLLLVNLEFLNSEETR